VARKRLLIQGATGSIGRSTLSVVQEQRDQFQVIGLAAGSHVETLLQLAAEFEVPCVALSDTALEEALRAGASSRGIKRIYCGPDAVRDQAAECDYDLLVSALSGGAGFEPTAAALTRGIPVALANKETLVAAGPIMNRLARDHHTRILPIDSEHSALFQCLIGEEIASVRRIYLTTSGGPFWGRKFADLSQVTRDEALAHPTWEMGPKVTIDSATLFNKGLEVIEVERLFGIGPDQIEVVAHRQSVVHSMIEFIDGSIKAQLSTPDMRLPILYALSYPERVESQLVRTDFLAPRTWTFEPVPVREFPCLGLAFEALRRGGTAPAALSAADEIAVEAFLDGRIRFTDIPKLLSDTLSDWTNESLADLAGVRAADLRARASTRERLHQSTASIGGRAWC
jgi:1-deoxy-D-xylulose-5-phosphate reductoisomerase